MVRLEDIAKPGGLLADLRSSAAEPLPAPYDRVEAEKRAAQNSNAAKGLLDGFTALGMPLPSTPAEENAHIERFIAGLRKLLSRDDNWTFLKQLTLSLEHCTRCQTCVEACPVYLESGRNDICRPTYRSEILRRMVNEYARPGGAWKARLKGEHIELNAASLGRLLELSYRCTLCRRCAQACPVGVDNALLAREIRKLFSMELGIAPREIHQDGSVLQLRTGSSTGMNRLAAKDNIGFLDGELSELTGKPFETPWDREGAEVLLIHNAGEILAWPENVMATALILDAAGVSWTMSSEICGYDSVNYGVWYDDVQFARVALKQEEAARRLRVKKVVLGECGHGHKASMVIADRLLAGEGMVPRESVLVLLREIVGSGRLRLDAARNAFPVTLHDPCNMVRMMGIVEPQREILRRICPQFREMAPHGVQNYCCGGGSGFAIMAGHNFMDWRATLSGRRKLRQVLAAFADAPEPETKKYVCAPCSNCKGQFRDLFTYYGVWERSGILYGGLAELIANAMTELKQPFLQWEFH